MTCCRGTTAYQPMDAAALWRNSFSDTLPEIPGELGLPWLGVAFDFLNQPLPLIDRLFREHGSIFKVRVVGEQVVLVADADIAREILADKDSIYSTRHGWDFLIGELFKDGLLLRDGQEHRIHRELLQQAFLKEPLVGYLDLMRPIADEYFASGAWTTGRTMEVFPAVKELTLKMAAQVFFGVKLDKNLAFINKAISDIVYASGGLVRMALPFTLWGRGLAGRLQLLNYFRDLIPARRKNPTPDLFGQLCAVELDGRQLTDTEILNHAIFILMAAHDTTASSITSLIYELGKDQHWQDSLRQECRQFYAGGVFDFARAKELKHLGWAFKETLRLHPPLIVYPRKLMADTVLGGYRLPAGTRVAVLAHSIHRRADYWQDPDAFDPLRFSPEREEYKNPPSKYIPFGSGKHLCLGLTFAELQAKIVLSRILQNYEWQLADGYTAQFKVPLQEPVDELPIRFQKAG